MSFSFLGFIAQGGQLCRLAGHNFLDKTGFANYSKNMTMDEEIYCVCLD